jgi:hypothetical protein
MNKIRQLFFLVLFPFLPFWAWALFQVTDTSIQILISLVLIPFACYALLFRDVRMPAYLFFFLMFTIYHLGSIYINNLLPPQSTWFRFILANSNVVAFLMFFVIENTRFDGRFIKTMNTNIFIIVVISLVVSVIQIKMPSFFISPVVLAVSEGVTHLSENRLYSIYSWVGLNSVGITFPILIAILLNFYTGKKYHFLIIIISGIVVAFLTKARYVMLGVLIVFSQFFFNSKIQVKRKVYMAMIFFGSLIISYYVALAIGYDIQQVIDERIMERGTNFGSVNTRVISYYVFKEKFPEHPLLGVGPQTRDDVVRLLGGRAPIIHVGYLAYLYYYGILGFSFMLISLLFLMRDSWVVGKKYGLWGAFYGILTFLVVNTTLVYFNFSEMGIILIVLYLRYFKDHTHEGYSITGLKKISKEPEKKIATWITQE